MEYSEFIARALLALQAAFVFGVTVVAVVVYWQHQRIGHIGMMAISYSLLIGVVTHSMYVESYPRLSGKGAIIFCAYLIGDFALIRLLTYEKNGSAGAQPKEFWQEENRKVMSDAVKPLQAEIAELKALLSKERER